METTKNIMMPDLDVAPRPARQRLEKAWPETLPRGLFVGELLLRELTHIAQDDFRGTALPAKLAELGEPVLVRTDPAGEEVEAFLRLPGGEIALLDVSHGDLSIEVAGATRGAADAAAALLRCCAASSPPNPRRRRACRSPSGCGAIEAVTSATARSRRPASTRSPITTQAQPAGRSGGSWRCALPSAAG